MSRSHLRSCIKDDQLILRRLVREEVNTRVKLTEIEKEHVETTSRVNSIKLQLDMICETAFRKLDTYSTGEIPVSQFILWFFDVSSSDEKIERSFEIFKRVNTLSNDVINMDETIRFHSELIKHF